MARPPTTVTLRWCAECGRDDRVTPFTGAWHWWRGARCEGQPIVLKYTLNEATADEAEERLNELKRCRDALVVVRAWIRDGEGTEADAAEAMDAALAHNVMHPHVDGEEVMPR